MSMGTFKSIVPALAIVLALFVSRTSSAQNPPMNCTPDGIIEVCTLADTTPGSAPAAAPATVAAPAAIPAPVVPSVPLPKVTYKNGLLTIAAENVPLIDVLHEVSAKTGTKIEVPPGSGTEAVFANVGPGPVRDVLVALLNGSPFNYVFAGSPNTNGSLDSVVLTSANAASEVAQSSAPTPPPAAAAPTPSNQMVGLLPDETQAAFAAQMEQTRQEVLQRLMADHQQQLQQQGSTPTAPPQAPPQAPAGADDSPAQP